MDPLQIARSHPTRRTLLLGSLLVLGAVRASQANQPHQAPKLSGPAGASGLAERLRDGQHVLLMRHAYAPGVGDPPGFSLARCETQRVLNDEGQRQAVRIGQWLRAQAVGQAAVFSSPWCRSRETAELLGFSGVTVEPALGSFFAEPREGAAQNQRLQVFIARKLREQRQEDKRGRAVLLVTHHVNIRELAGVDVGSGDLVLVRVDGQGRVVNVHTYSSP